MSKYRMKSKSGEITVVDEEPVGFPPKEGYRFVCTENNDGGLRACAWVSEDLLTEIGG